MNGESLDLTEDLIYHLKALIPAAFSEGKIDVLSLKTLIGEDNVSIGERYELNWPGKSNSYKVLQRPITETLVPNSEDSINWDQTENVFIEGENLAVLKVLQKSYYGKIKMIYIDPPYNTGSDSFIYPDKFSESREEYAQRIGTKDEEGYMMKDGMFRKNSKDGGHYHSNWLNMMLPRLHLARNLLAEDGVIFVSIDDNEQANLKLLMDQVFGDDNFITTFIWEKRTNRENRKQISSRHDYVVCYCRNIDRAPDAISLLPMSREALARYKNPDNDSRGLWKSDPATAQSGHATSSQFYTLIAPNGKEHEPPSGRCWVYTIEVMQSEIEKERIWFGKEGNNVPRIKTYLNEKDRGLVPETILFAKEASTNEDSKKKVKELFKGKAVFETPKPTELLQVLINIGDSSKDTIFLDFFSGSGTLGQAVLDLNEKDGGNRKFICVQLPEITDEKSEAYKAGYKTISAVAEARITKVIKKIELEREGKLPLESRQTLGFRKFILQDSNFKIWRGNMKDTEKLKQQMLEFVTPEKKGSLTEDILWELLVKNGKLLTEKLIKYEVQDGAVWSIQDGSIAFALDTWNNSVTSKLLELKPQKVIALDSVFDNNDSKKSNAQLQCEDAGISFTTV